MSIVIVVSAVWAMPPGSVAVVPVAEKEDTLPGSVSIVPGGRARVCGDGVSRAAAGVVVVAVNCVAIVEATKGGLPTPARNLILMKVGSLSRTLLCHNRVQDRPREICPNGHK